MVDASRLPRGRATRAFLCTARKSSGAQWLAAGLSGALKAAGRDGPRDSPGRPGRARFRAKRRSKGPRPKAATGLPARSAPEPATKPGGAGG